MLKGRVIIDFEYDEEKDCSWNLTQDGKDKLNNENLVYLLQHVTSEIIS